MVYIFGKNLRSSQLFATAKGIGKGNYRVIERLGDFSDSARRQILMVTPDAKANSLYKEIIAEANYLGMSVIW